MLGKSKILLKLNFSQLLKESFFVFVLKIVGVGLGFIVNIIIARYYGADTLGLIALINSFISILSLFVLFGTNTAILKLIPKYSVKYDILVAFRVYKKALLLIFLISLAVSIIAYFISPVIAIDFFHNEKLYHFLQLYLFLYFLFQ